MLKHFASLEVEEARRNHQKRLGEKSSSYKCRRKNQENIVSENQVRNMLNATARLNNRPENCPFDLVLCELWKEHFWQSDKG